MVVNNGGITVTLSVLRAHPTHKGTHIQGLMLLAIIAMHSTWRSVHTCRAVFPVSVVVRCALPVLS